MVSRSFVAAGSLAALLCLTASAQTAGAQSTGAAPSTASPGSSTPAAPAGGLQPGAPPLRLQSLPPDAHTPTPAEQEEQHQRQVMAAAVRIASMQAHWGPQMSTPGMSAALVEAARSKTPAGVTQITYHVTASGFRPDERLMLVRWPLDSRMETIMGGLVLNSSGTVVCGAPEAGQPATQNPPPPSSAAPGNTPAAPPTPPPPPSCTATMKPDQPLSIETAAAPGEAVRVGLVDQNHRNGAATSAVPYPIANQDQGCKLQVFLGTRDASMVLLEGNGFPPNAAVQLDTITAGQTRVVNAKTDSHGDLAIAVLSGAPGHDSGNTTVRYAGPSPAPGQKDPGSPPPAASCAPSVTFPWGAGSYKPE